MHYSRESLICKLGPNSLFIRILLDKKYALPYKVVDALVFHFIRLSNTYKAKLGESEKLPVLWHQSLLIFCQRSAHAHWFSVLLVTDSNDHLPLSDMPPTLRQIKKMRCSTSCVRTHIHKSPPKFVENSSTR
jgi:hypothetical protein